MKPLNEKSHVGRVRFFCVAKKRNPTFILLSEIRFLQKIGFLKIRTSRVYLHRFRLELNFQENVGLRFFALQKKLTRPT
jgi:hypothetical protein